MFTIKENQEHRSPREEDKNSLENALVASSRNLIRAITAWKPETRKMLVMCMSKIDWRTCGNSNTIELSKKEVLEVLGINVDSDHQTEYLRKVLRRIRANSEVNWTDPDNEEFFEDGFLFYKTFCRKRGKIRMIIDPDYMPMLENLLQSKNYLQMWSNDQYKFNSKFAFALYDALQLRYDFRYTKTYISFTTDQLKKIFGLSDTDYVRKANGQFDRNAFERYVLDVAIDEINNSEMMAIVPKTKDRSGKAKFYEKTKQDGYIKEYIFTVMMFPKRVENPVIIDQDNQIENKSVEDWNKTAEELPKTEGFNPRELLDEGLPWNN